MAHQVTQGVATLGVFDGVHRGHQQIFKKVRQRSRQLGTSSLVYTFDPHPARVLVPKSCPRMIMTLRQKIATIQSYGIQRVVVQKFTRSFSRLTPQQFFQRILVQKLKVSEIFIGYDFTFGYHRRGTAEQLEQMGREAGIRVHVVAPFLWKEILVSSTQIRERLAQAELKQARELLGHPYQMEGRVVRGKGRGKKLGIPTANLQSDNDQLLPTGVYATWTEVANRRYRSVTNIGCNPTFGGGPLSIESHLLDFNRPLLGKQIRIEFVARIRAEKTFASPQALVTQIQRDIRTARFKALLDAL